MSKTSNNLEGRTMWVPRMTYAGAHAAAAVFRSVGVDAHVTPESDHRTLELGGLYSSGEECYPEQITVGDFLRIVKSPDFDRTRHAFFMPTAEGPCRFGQYSPYFRQILDEMGYTDVPIISPTSRNSYSEVSSHGTHMVRTLWRGLVASDILRKMLLKTRPYETNPGQTDGVFKKSVRSICEVLEIPGQKFSDCMINLSETLIKCRDEFRNIPARYVRGRPLIGVVGEIFCRLNTFSNRDAVKKLEAAGAEVWMSDVSEWVWYTNWSRKGKLERLGKKFSIAMLGAKVRDWVQHIDEKKLLAGFEEDFHGYEEPHDIYADVIKPAWDYLPGDGAWGEMMLSVGKAVYMYQKGADGIVDISPFACMNGIVSEAVYHKVSEDCGKLPIRNFYFDASNSNMERDVDIFMELVSGYSRRKTTKRNYPHYFE